MITQEITVVNREPLHEKRGEARPSSSSKGVEDEETLEPGALVRELPHPVENQVDDLLPDGVVAASVVVGGVLLPGHQLLRVEELTVGSGSNLVNHRWLKVDKDGPGDVLACAGLGEEGVEGVVAAADSLVRGHLAVRLDPMLEAVELPAGIAHLASRLTNVHADTLTLREKVFRKEKLRRIQTKRIPFRSMLN